MKEIIIELDLDDHIDDEALYEHLPERADIISAAYLHGTTVSIKVKYEECEDEDSD